MFARHADMTNRRRISSLASIILLPALFLTGCGDDDSTTGPSSAPLIFSAVLRPANEVPPVSNAEQSGFGSVQVQMNVTRGAGDAITAATAQFYFDLTRFPEGTTVVGAHIHPGAFGVNGPVTVNSTLSAARPAVVSGGNVVYESPVVTVDPVTAQAIINNPAGFYFNTHSTLNPGGVARGQLERVR